MEESVNIDWESSGRYIPLRQKIAMRKDINRRQHTTVPVGNQAIASNIPGPFQGLKLK